MKTAQLNGIAVNGKANGTTSTVAKTTTNTGQQVNGLPISKNFDKAENDPAKNTPITEQPKTELKKEETPKPQAEEVKAEAPKIDKEEPKAELTKVEIKEQLKEERPALNLEATIKLALDLNRRINHRGKLLETIENLEKFEVAQKDDADEAGDNHFQGCELTIEDDKGREFTTKNPFIIRLVAKMVNTLCVDKLAEIEGEIFIPVK